MRPNPTHTLPKSFSLWFISLLPVDLESCFISQPLTSVLSPWALSQLKRKQHLKKKDWEKAEGEKQQGSECRGSASVLPSCWESANLPPTHECGCSWELWSRPNWKAARANQDESWPLVWQMSPRSHKCCGDLEGWLELCFPRSLGEDWATGDRVFGRNTLYSSPFIPWKTRDHWPSYLIYPQMLLPVIISKSKLSRRWVSTPPSPGLLAPLQCSYLSSLLDYEPMEGHGEALSHSF